MNKLIMLFSLFFVVSCGKDFKIESPSELITSYMEAPKVSDDPVPYSYEFYGKSCSTGKHEAYTLAKICETLIDDTQNNSCAEEERVKLYQSNCARITSL